MVLKVLGDILRVVDSGDLAVLTLLDLSAAFDTVKRVTFLRRLSVSYGLGGVVIVTGTFAAFVVRLPSLFSSYSSSQWG